MNGCPCDKCMNFYTCDNMGTSDECSMLNYKYYEEREEEDNDDIRRIKKKNTRIK